MGKFTRRIENRRGDFPKAASRLSAEHESETGSLQHAVDRLTAGAGHPFSIGLVAAAMVGWVAVNTAASYFRIQPFDPPPFIWLQGAVAVLGLLIAMLILTTQRREAQLANHRADLILEFVILAEQKSAKAIELLEEARRDNPLLSNRSDSEALEMSTPTDHRSMLDAIKNSGATGPENGQ